LDHLAWPSAADSAAETTLLAATVVPAVVAECITHLAVQEQPVKVLLVVQRLKVMHTPLVVVVAPVVQVAPETFRRKTVAPRDRVWLAQ
jgi:hypothetical protein